MQTNFVCFNPHELPVIGSLLLPGKGAAVPALRRAIYKWHTSIKKNEINVAIISFAAGGAAIFLSGNWDAPVQHRESSKGLTHSFPSQFCSGLQGLTTAKSSERRAATKVQHLRRFLPARLKNKAALTSSLAVTPSRACSRLSCSIPSFLSVGKIPPVPVARWEKSLLSPWHGGNRSQQRLGPPWGSTGRDLGS